MDDEELDEQDAEGGAGHDGGKFVCPVCSREYTRSGTCPEDGEELLPEKDLSENM